MKAGELARLREMYRYENLLYHRGVKIIAGVDEAGRGPLAGPVAAAIVILPKLEHDDGFAELAGLNDSKKLSAKKREYFYQKLIAHPQISIGVGIISEKIIDRYNILRATHLAVRKALANLEIAPEFILIDGMKVPGIQLPQQKIINGDQLSLSIAAASVVAKVTRDGIMCQYHEIYPQYAFNKHKGYGTKDHFQKLREYGPCKIHRRTFAPISLMREIDYGF